MVMTMGAMFIVLQSFTIGHAQGKDGFKLLKTETLTIEDQAYLLLKGELTVAEDRTKSDSRKLTLPVQIIKAKQADAGPPIFWLDGGPGASNILSIEKIVSTTPTKLLAHHDFVCVGYRGVDGSTVLRSRKINKAFRATRHELLSDASLDNVEAKIKTYCATLSNAGIDINQYTIVDVTEDVDYAREVLGYASINLLSSSYGTRVALLYGYRFPSRLARTVMVGACPPGYFLTRPEQAENTIAHYDSLYQLQEDAVHKGSIKEAMRLAFSRMPKRWATFRLDADKIKAGTMGMLYARGSAVWAFQAYFSAAQEGDFSSLFLLQKLYEMNSKSVIGDVYAKTVSADIDYNAIDLNTRKRFRSSTTLLGNNISAIYGSTAHAWSIKSIPDEYKRCRVSASEILIISGDLDFRTPADVTDRELMPFLKNGKHVVLKNLSHSDLLLRVMKSQDFLFQYFDFGTVDESLVELSPDVNFAAPSKTRKAKVFVIGLLF